MGLWIHMCTSSLVHKCVCCSIGTKGFNWYQRLEMSTSTCNVYFYWMHSCRWTDRHIPVMRLFYTLQIFFFSHLLCTYIICRVCYKCICWISTDSWMSYDQWKWVVSFTPRPFYPGERAPGTHWIGGWVGLRASLDDVMRTFLTLPGFELWFLGRPASIQSLYRLRYPGSTSIKE
jgi:hypothetical protein